MAGRRCRGTSARSSTSARLSGGRHRHSRLAVPTVSASLRYRLLDNRILRQRLLAEPASAVDHRHRRVCYAGDGTRRRGAGGGGWRQTGGGRRRPVARRVDRDGGDEQRRGAHDVTARSRVRRRRRCALSTGVVGGVCYSADARADGRLSSTTLHRRTTVAADQRRETTLSPSSAIYAARPRTRGQLSANHSRTRR